MVPTHTRWLLIALTLALIAPAAHAQFAVIDVANLAQLIQQFQTLQQQVQTAQQQLSQAQSEYAAITGGRGMQQLLNAEPRNYLPADWAQLQSLTQGVGGTYAGLAASVQSLVTASAVLTPQQVAALSPQEQAQLQAARNAAALLQATSQQALSTTSARFSSLQQLINTLGGATDQKASLDLQARVAAEQAMLANEHTKIDVLQQALQAQAVARQQQIQERAVADVGSFRQLPKMGL